MYKYSRADVISPPGLTAVRNPTACHLFNSAQTCKSEAFQRDVM